MIRSTPPINTITTTDDDYDDAYAYGGESKLDDYYHHHPHYLNRMHSTSNNSTTTHHGMKSPQHQHHQQQPATAAVNNSIHWDVEEGKLTHPNNNALLLFHIILVHLSRVSNIRLFVCWPTLLYIRPPPLLLPRGGSQ